MRPRWRCRESPAIMDPAMGRRAACSAGSMPVDVQPLAPLKDRIAAMKINKWVLATILFLFAAGMYAGVILKMF